MIADVLFAWVCVFFLFFVFVFATAIFGSIDPELNSVIIGNFFGLKLCGTTATGS